MNYEWKFYNVEVSQSLLGADFLGVKSLLSGIKANTLLILRPTAVCRGRDRSPASHRNSILNLIH